MTAISMPVLLAQNRPRTQREAMSTIVDGEGDLNEMRVRVSSPYPDVLSAPMAANSNGVV